MSVWLRPLADWPLALSRALEATPAVVRIMLATVRGSAPREPGVSMLVTPATVLGTIGGGQLEWQSVGAARAMLATTAESAQLQRLVLAADLGQCCGGVVEVWMERYTRADATLLETAVRAAGRGPAVLHSTLTAGGVERRLIGTCGFDAHSDALLRAPRAGAAPRVQRGAAGEITLRERLDDALPPVWLFGAGHVGQALARILVELPLRLTWIDSRAELLPSTSAAFGTDIARTVHILHCSDPLDSVRRAPAGARYLVMTHSHTLDYALCRAILQRGDFASAGLIGSKSKAARFRARLAADGISAERISLLVSPIGIEGIASKWPAAIAVAAAAQLLCDLGAEDAGKRLRRAPQRTATFEPARAAVSACGEIGCAHCGAGRTAPASGTSPLC